VAQELNMTKITFGPNGYDLPRLFVGEFPPQVKVVSKSSKGFVMEYNDPDHTRVVVKGSKLSYGPDDLPTKGTITSWTKSSDTGLTGTAKNLKISASSLMVAARTEDRTDDVFYSKVLSGKDVITGSKSNDYLNGYAGKDTLTGGRGDDLLVGGKGADKFVYKSVHDSPSIPGEVADLIADFSHAQRDKIDLKTIDANTKKSGNQAFTFIGKNDFTKAGQLRYEYYQDLDEGSHGVLLRGDVDGDGETDFKIFVADIMQLVKGDFYL
jgi:Ca2+-binding RTX toxin-like protein